MDGPDPATGAAGAQQPDLRRGLADLKAASADGAAKCVADGRAGPSTDPNPST